MSNLIIPMGIPGCGKSTWARTLLARKYHIVSSDEIRKSKFGSLKAAHEPGVSSGDVWSAFYREIEDCLAHNVDVFADATNLRQDHRQRLRDIASRTKAKTHLVVFGNLLEAESRNLQRKADEKVSVEVIDGMKDLYWEALEAIKYEQFDHSMLITSYL